MPVLGETLRRLLEERLAAGELTVSVRGKTIHFNSLIAWGKAAGFDGGNFSRLLSGRYDAGLKTIARLLPLFPSEEQAAELCAAYLQDEADRLLIERPLARRILAANARSDMRKE